MGLLVNIHSTTGDFGSYTLSESGDIMEFGISFTNVGIVILDVLLVWACFSVDSYLKCQEADDDQFALHTQETSRLSEHAVRSRLDY